MSESTAADTMAAGRLWVVCRADRSADTLHQRSRRRKLFTIASAIDLGWWFTVAEADPRVFKAMVRLLRSLLLEPAPLGGLLDLEHPEEVLDRYLDLLSELGGF